MDPPAVSREIVVEDSATNYKEMRIIGGQDANQSRYGFMVSLEDKFGHFCGGTLVRPDTVISAAHCGGGSMWVRVGAHDISNQNEGKSIKVSKQIIHNKYNADKTDFDYMVLILDEPVPAGTAMAKLHRKDDLADGDSLQVIGWGNTNANGFRPADELQHVEVKYIPNNQCNSQNAYAGDISSAMLCAGEAKGGEE